MTRSIRPGATLPAVLALAVTASVSVPRIAAATGLDVRGWLERPGVKLLAVEFYATWCKPCMEAVPRWRELHDKYRKDGLRLVVVATQDPEAGCVNPGWNPDEVICDDDGQLARLMGAGDCLPAAFLWSWQGNLLVRKGHVDEVEESIEKWIDTAPRVDVRVARVSKAAAVAEGELRDLVRGELGRSAKLTVVASEEERRRLAEVKRAAFEKRFDEKSRCELGKELSANSLLEVNVLGREERQRLRLGLLSVERGCLVGSALVDWNRNLPTVSVAEAVSELFQKLRPEIQMPRGRSMTFASSRRRAVEEDIGERFESWDPSVGQQRVIVGFESDPPGAVVLLDGELLCQNTERGCSRNIPKGVHTVTMQRERYEKRSERMSIDAATTIAWKLEPSFGTFDVTSEPAGLELKVDGRTIGRTPVVGLELDPGRRELLVSDACFFDRGKRLVVKPGERRELAFDMKARMGALDVIAVDRAGNAQRGEVWVDGARIGKAPGVFKVPVCARELEIRRDGRSFHRSKLAIREKTLGHLRAVMGPAIDPRSSGGDRSRALVYLNPEHVDLGPDGRSTGSKSEGGALAAAVRAARADVVTFDRMSDFSRMSAGRGVLVIPELEKGSPSVSPEDAAALRGFVSSGGTLVMTLDNPKKQRGPAFLQSVFGWSLQTKASARGKRSNRTAEARRLGFKTVALPHNNDCDAVERSSLPRGALSLYADDAGDPVVALVPVGSGYVAVLGWDWFDGAPLGSVDGGWRDVLARVFELEAPEPAPSVTRRRVAFYANRKSVDLREGAKDSEGAALKAALRATGRQVSSFEDLRGRRVAGSIEGADVVVIPDLEKTTPPTDARGTAALRAFVEDGGVLVTVLDESGKDRSIRLLNQIFAWRLVGKSRPAGAASKRTAEAARLGFAGPGRIAHNFDSDALVRSSLPSGATALYLDDAGDSTLTVVSRGRGFVAVLGWDWYDGVPLGKQDGGWAAALAAVLELSLPSAAVAAPSTAGPIAVFTDPAAVDFRADDPMSEGVALLNAVRAAGLGVNTVESLAGGNVAAQLAGRRVFVVPDLEKDDPRYDRQAVRDLRGFVRGGGTLVTVLDESGEDRAARLLGKLFGFRLEVKASPKGKVFRRTEAAAGLGRGAPATLTANNDVDAVTRRSLPSIASVYYQDDDGDALVASIPVEAGRVMVLGWDWYDAAPAGKQDGGWNQLMQTLVRSSSAGGPESSTNGGPVAGPEIAFVNDPRFVDLQGGAGALQSLTRNLGFKLEPFYLGALGAVYRRLDTIKVALVPPLNPREEARQLARQIKKSAKGVRAFVARGGRLVALFGPTVADRGTAGLLRYVVRYRDPELARPSGPIRLDPATADALELSGLPSSLDVLAGVSTVDVGRLPRGARALYTDATGRAVVASIPLKRGEVIVVGCDWAHLGSTAGRGGGWHELMNGLLR